MDSRCWLYSCEILILFVTKKQDYGDKNLVCSMITISENAALRRTLSAQKWFFVVIAISKSVRILFSVNFSQCDLEHKHDQCECDSITEEGCYASPNRVKFFTYLFPWQELNSASQ